MKRLIQKLKYTLAAFTIISGFSMVFLAPGVLADGLFDGAKKEACAGTRLVSDPSGTDCTAADEENLSNTIQDGISLVSVVVGIIAVIMIIIGGFRFVVSNGDSGKITTARNTIIYALIGLILAALAQVIVRFVLGNV
jgi:hypothetical protein